jgi:hypothetical protein
MEGDFEREFVIALQVPLRAAKIHPLPFNARCSQKTSEHSTTASIAGLRNASHDSCRFSVESTHICRDRESLVIAHLADRCAFNALL